MKFYGSLINRIDENKNYAGTIVPDTDITMYYWSDRHCYYVTRVVDQKHIFVKQYHVCANHHKPGGMGHQDWLYFKTAREEQEYINKCVKEGLLPDYCYHDINDVREDNESEWVFRYGHWNYVFRIAKWTGKPLEKPEYSRIRQEVSFGVRDYYYDWEF